MIRRVKVQGYKSLKDIEVELRPLTVIFGPNAAGKSNLFDALALLSRMVTQRTLREARCTLPRAVHVYSETEHSCGGCDTGEPDHFATSLTAPSKKRR